MRRTRRFLVVGLLMVVLALLFGVWRAGPRVPHYAGKTLYEWIGEYERTRQALYGGGGKAEDLDRSLQALEDTQKAIRQIGTGALPFLMADMRARITVKDKVVVWLNRQPFLKISSKTAVERWDRAVRGLEALGPIAKPCVPELAVIATNNVGFGPSALVAVGPDALPAVTNLLVGLPRGVTQNLTVALLNAMYSDRIQPEEAAMAVPALLVVFRSKDARAGRYAVKALGYMKQRPEQCVPALMERMADPSLPLHAECLGALAQFGEVSEDQIEKVARVVERADPRSRAVLQKALAQCSSAGDAAALILMEGLADPDPDVRLAAATGLGELRAQAGMALPALIETAHDTNALVRGMTIQSIGRLGRHASNAIPTLERACADPDPFVRTTASNALLRIEQDTKRPAE